jgi:methionyl-tRNA formyltransferase
VVTRPDRPKGRGRKLSPPPVAEAARELGLELDQPESVNSGEARARIAAAEPEVLVICAFGAFIREPLLTEYPVLNVHPSLLPRWRGAAPIERAIEAGDQVTGVTIMRPTEEMDGGPICLQREEPIRPDDDFGTLSARLMELGADLLIEALDTSPPLREQPEEGVTIAPKIGPEDRRLDPSLTAVELERRVRALTPHIGAFIELDGGERLGVRRAAAVRENAHTGPSPAFARGGGVEQGSLEAAEGRLFLGCRESALELLEVQPPGGRPMEAAAWLRGHGAKLGRAA